MQFTINYDNTREPNTMVVVQGSETAQVGYYHLHGNPTEHWKLLLRQLIDSEQYDLA